MSAISPERSEAHVLAYSLFKWDPFGRQIVGLLDDSYFTRPFHVDVFNCLKEGESISDPDAIFSFVRGRVANNKELTSLVGRHCGLAENRRSHFEWHLGQLRLARAERRTRDLGASLADSLESGELALHEIRSEVDAIEKELAAEVTGGNLHEIIAAINETKSRDWIGTGFRALDEQISGLRGGDMCVVAATPGIGKTAFALHVAMHNARKDRPALIASYEMQKEDLWFRLLASYTGIPLSRFFDSSKMSPDNRSELVLAINEADRWPLHVVRPDKRYVRALEAMASRVNEKQPLKLIIVDYLQLLAGTNQKASRYEQVSEISTGIKDMAMRLNVPVIVLAQLNRQAAKDTPQMHHLRDSGQIEQDADIILLLSRTDESTKTLVNVQIEKVRRGRTGLTIQVAFDGATQRWSEPNRVQEFDDFNND